MKKGRATRRTTITEEMVDQVEQALYQSALNGSAPAAKWLLVNRRPMMWAIDGNPTGEDEGSNLFDLLLEALERGIPGGEDRPRAQEMPQGDGTDPTAKLTEWDKIKGENGWF